MKKKSLNIIFIYKIYRPNIQRKNCKYTTPLKAFYQHLSNVIQKRNHCFIICCLLNYKKMFMFHFFKQFC